MKHPCLTIQRLCEQENIHPIELLGVLLDTLQGRHLMQAGFNFQDPTNQGNVFGEIASMLNWFNPPIEPPPSLLATLEVVVRVQHDMDAHNAENAKKHGRESEGLSRKAKAGRVLRAALQESMNEAERQGIEYRINIEKRWEDERKRKESGDQQ